MTLPPCFSPSSARHYSKYSSVFRHTPKSKQKRPLENSVLAMMPQTQMISRIRSATPEEEPEAASYQSKNNNEAENEDNAALMLLQLSKIVTKEISSDSGCMAKPKEEEEEESPAASPVPNNIDIAIQFKIEQTSNHRSTIPECSSSSSLSSSESMESEEDSNHDDDLQVQNQPSPPICFSSPARRQMPRSASIESLASDNNNNQHQHPMVAQHQPNRYRTVSLAGDDMYPVCNNNERDLSPVLLPLDSPCHAAAKARERLSSLGIHVTTPSPPRRNSLPRPRFHHHPLFQQELNLLEQQQIFLHQQQQQQQQQQQEQHQILQQQEHEKREAFRMALRGVMNAASNAAASIVTPIPQEPRHVLSSSFAGVDGFVHRSEESSSSSKGSHAPLELPPPLLRNGNANAQPATIVSIENNIQPIARLHQPPQKKVAVAAASVLPKKKQTASNKKHARPQRTGGKKFSWKNYPELEEFLIQNREEYLCFSAKNYTIEQRDYNNRLTARLLDHANNNGYSSLFETSAFSVVRDRIRSYYKSYVQSFKRRKERQLQQQIRQRAAATTTTTAAN